MAFNSCDVGEGVTEFVGIYGGQTCSTYDIKIVPFTGDCKEPGHHVHSSTSKSARQLEANTGVFDSCDSHGWKDFYLDLDNEDMFESDFIFEVVLNSEFRSNPNALTMYLFEKEIPRNRKTSFVEFDADGHGVYSLALSTTRLKDLFAVGDKVFVSVRCGSLPVQFKILMFAKSPVLTLGSYQHFEICRDDWRDLFFDVPASFSIYQHRGGFVRFSVEKFEGDASFKAQEEERPLKMTYPFVEMRENDEKTTVDICNAEPGVRAYLAVRGGDVCAVLKVKVSFYTDDDIVGGGVDPCDEEANASHTLEANVVELVKDEFYYDSCEAGSYPMMTYSFKVTENERYDNLVFQLEQMLGDDRSDPSAVAFYGYYRDHVPELDREGSADMRSLEAKHNVHTLSLNYIDLHYGKNTHLSFAVRCGPHGGAKFNILAHQIRARMHVSRRVISEVCPEKWIYHYIDTEETLVAGSFLRLRVRVLSGDVFCISVRTGFPPSFNTENDTDLTPAASLTKDKIYEYTIHVCDLKEGERIFIGLFGAKTGCAKYEVLPTILGGSKEGGCVNHHGDDHIYSQR